MHIYHNNFIHLCIEGHLDCFGILAIWHNAAINMRGQVYLWGSDLFPLHIYPEKGIYESCFTYIFRSFWKFCTIFHNDFTNSKIHVKPQNILNNQNDRRIDLMLSNCIVKLQNKKDRKKEKEKKKKGGICIKTDT